MANATLTSTAVDYWKVTANDLRAQLDTIRESIAQNERDRRSLAVASSTGDADARAAMSDLRSARVDLEDEADQITLALDEASRELAAAEKAAADEAHRVRLGEVADLASKLLASAGRVDAAAIKLGRAIEEVMAVRRALSSYEDLHHMRGDGLAPAYTYANALSAASPVFRSCLDGLRPLRAEALADYEKSVWSKFLPADAEKDNKKE